MNVVSLFSGVGGFDLGFEQAGFRTVYQCEWDKHATNILNRHWPDVPKWGDIQTLTGDEILRHCQTPDVIIWGSPCQDLSVAGKRAGLAGERSGLFHEGIRIINELREATDGRYPRVSVWENVAGALNSNRGADFGAVLDEMAAAGALVIEWALLDAQYFGVPQRRRRVFVVAVFDPATADRCPDPLLPVSESLPRHFAKGTKKGQAAAGEVAAGVGTGGDGNTVGTLNCHDGTKWGSNQWMGEGKAIVEPATDDTRTTTAIVGSLQARDYKGLNHEAARDGKAIIEQPAAPLTARDAKSVRTDAANTHLVAEWWNGGNTADTLTATSDMQRMPDKQRLQAIIEQPMLLDGRRINDVRVYEPPVQTLEARMGTGGGNVPMLAEPVLQYDGYNQKINDTDVSVTLRIGRDSSDFVAQPVAFATNQRAEVRELGDKSVALSAEPGTNQQTYLAQPAIGIQGTVIGRQDHNGPSGTGHTQEDGPMFTLTARDTHAVAASMTVRRLTPIECERLMGWPDGWTDGQADSHRYKQCGNGVASPVARWIATHLSRVLN